jgi:hypothetical protein
MPGEDEKIINALRDERWDYRTADAIAKETGVPVERVLEFLESRNDIVLKASLPDRLGRDLYTFRDRQSLTNNFWRNFSTFTTKVSS